MSCSGNDALQHRTPTISTPLSLGAPVIVSSRERVIKHRNVGAPGAALGDIFDLQRAPATWFDDLPLDGEGLQWADKLDCSIATGLAVALASRQSQPLLSFDARLTEVPDITFLRLPRPKR